MDRFSRVGFDEMTNAFLNCNSVDPKLVPDNWIHNSLKWIILKLAGYEHSYPHQYASNGLTPANVMSQLKYRYDREIDRAQRSAIRKIVEQDDAASKPLVLFVSRIRMLSPIEYSLELSDGWYAIGTSPLDAVLSQAVYKKKIRVGTKLLIQDAELIGTEEPCSPLEVNDLHFPLPDMQRYVSVLFADACVDCIKILGELNKTCQMAYTIGLLHQRTTDCVPNEIDHSAWRTYLQFYSIHCSCLSDAVCGECAKHH